MSSSSGDELRQQLEFAQTSKRLFSFTPDGSLNVHSLDKVTRKGGSFGLILPKEISNYSFFMLEITCKIGDAASISANYNDETDTIFRSYSQKTPEDIFVFETKDTRYVTLHFDNIKEDPPTIIDKIRVYGLYE